MARSKYYHSTLSQSNLSMFKQLWRQRTDGRWGGLVLLKCQQLVVSKNFPGQTLSHWLKKLKNGYGYHESADTAYNIRCADMGLGKILEN